jgi:hypothetical protein
VSDSNGDVDSGIIDRILELHAKMTVHALTSGVGPGLWEKLIKNPTKWDDRRRIFILTFLEKLYRDEWKKIEDHKNQFCATEEMWINMNELFDEEDFPEIRKLKELQKNLKARWIKFKEDYKALLDELRGK